MDDCILFNAACSKCRGALDLLRSRGREARVVEYLKAPPTVADLTELCRLGGWTAKELVRDEPKRLRELGLALDDRRDERGWLQVLHDHPELLQRPIVVIGGRAVIGRPPEKVLDLLDG